MRALVWCFVLSAMASCKQQPDAFYVGADNAPRLAQLRTLFNQGFYDACLNTPPPEIDPRTDEPVCGPPPPECEALWEQRPIGQPEEWEDPEGYAAYHAAWDTWQAERDAMLEQCSLNWEGITCWPSQMVQALNRVLAKRDKLRAALQDTLSAEARDDLPAELRGLLLEGWICNWSVNSKKRSIRFGTPIEPPG